MRRGQRRTGIEDPRYQCRVLAISEATGNADDVYGLKSARTRNTGSRASRHSPSTRMTSEHIKEIATSLEYGGNGKYDAANIRVVEVCGFVDSWPSDQDIDFLTTNPTYWVEQFSKIADHQDGQDDIPLE